MQSTRRSRRALARLLMVAGGLGAAGLAVIALLVSVEGAHTAGSTRGSLPATGTVAPAAGFSTPPPILALRARLAPGAVLAHLAVPGAAAPLTVVEGLPATAGGAGHDPATAYPGEPHAMLVVAAPGVTVPATPPGTEMRLVTAYGSFRYRVSGAVLQAPGSPMGPDAPVLRLAVPVRGGFEVTTADLVPGDAATAAELAQEVAVSQAEARSSATAVPRTAPGTLGWPCLGPITQRFGPVDASFEFPFVYQGVYYPHFHTGLDIGVGTGTPIRAAADGVVVLATTNLVGGRPAGYGTYVVIAHGGGLYTLYGHLSQLEVTAGEHVAAGQLIGLSGSTGNSTGPHLHFEVREGRDPVDPLTLLPH